jgi:hypothetical protein
MMIELNRPLCSHFRERGREPSMSIRTLETMSMVCMMVAKES